MQEVVITYETLFELLKREKERTDLQKLEPTFFSDTINYIKDKKKILEAKSDSVFAADEGRKTKKKKKKKEREKKKKKKKKKRGGGERNTPLFFFFFFFPLSSQKASFR